MDFTYELGPLNQVKIYENGMPVVNQPISPITGEPFASAEEAETWAQEAIEVRKSWYN